MHVCSIASERETLSNQFRLEFWRIVTSVGARYQKGDLAELDHRDLEYDVIPIHLRWARHIQKTIYVTIRLWTFCGVNIRVP